MTTDHTPIGEQEGPKPIVSQFWGTWKPCWTVPKYIGTQQRVNAANVQQEWDKGEKAKAIL
ncbi:MAG: hypothetical protein KGZ49_04605 [Syntrophaceae bacterium]|nr:hypothetical protein [Syntrophaceae bacterium]